MLRILIVAFTALTLLVAPAMADNFGFDNVRDCLKFSDSGVCRTVEKEMTLNELLRQLTGVTLEEVAEENKVPLETLQDGEIILRPGIYFAV